MVARHHAVAALVSAAVLLTGAIVSATVFAGPVPTSGRAAAVDAPGCVTVPSKVVLGVRIADPACDFDGSAYTGSFGPMANSAGQLSEVWTGIAADGAAFRIEVPPHWNGTLVMYAHGYRGTGNVVWVDEPQLRPYFVDHGFAWAGSSYAVNGYDVGHGVVDTHDLLQAFPSVTGLHARQVIMTGASMGGEITVVEIEVYRGQFAGAMPYCGVLAGNDLFDDALRTIVTPAALAADALSPASLPAIQGDPGIPVLSMHDIGDLFVPFSMDQRYDARLVAHGEGNLFVGRAIRDVAHCGFTTTELSAGFAALVSWIATGQRPAGDDILDPRAVASPFFGCRFTDPTPGAHPAFKGLPCPAKSR